MTTYHIHTTDSARTADRVRVYRSGVLVAEVSADFIVAAAKGLRVTHRNDLVDLDDWIADLARRGES